MTDAEGRLSMPASQIVRQERTDRQGWRFALSDMGVFLSADETDSSVLKLSFERVRRGLLKAIAEADSRPMHAEDSVIRDC